MLIGFKVPILYANKKKHQRRVVDVRVPGNKIIKILRNQGNIECTLAQLGLVWLKPVLK